MSKKTERLEKIRADILKQKICPDLAKGATQLVFGDGNPDAELVFIGEAPGKNEDIQGLPFVGAAGKFLNEMLALIGLKREDVYITNIVKYRPPENRDPLPDEKAAFLPFLKKQILVIQPKLIVALGRHSMETLLPGLRISECHGQPKRVKVKLPMTHTSHELEGSARKKRSTEQTVQGVQSVSTGASDTAMSQEGGPTVSWVVLPLFHPAAALYNGAMRQTLIGDFIRIPIILKKIES